MKLTNGLTVVDAVGVMILEHGQKQMEGHKHQRLTSLCQQNVEKIIPTYVHGTVMPLISDLI